MIIKIWRVILLIVGFLSIIFAVVGFFAEIENKGFENDPGLTITVVLFFLSIGAICLYFGFSSKQKKVVKLAMKKFNRFGYIDTKEIALELGIPHKKVEKMISDAQNKEKLPKTKGSEVKNEIMEISIDNKEYKKSQQSDNKFEKLNSLLKEQANPKG